MFRLELTIPFLSVRTEMMCRAVEMNVYRYIAWHIRVWKYKFILDWGKSREEELMSTKKQVSWQEFGMGALATVLSFAFIGWWALVLSPACGLLWMLGGTYDKAIRRWGVNAVLLAAAVLSSGWHWWYTAAFILGVIVLYQGDGFPDHRPTTKDPGSRLGRLVEKFIPSENPGGIVTKLLAVALFQIAVAIYIIG